MTDDGPVHVTITYSEEDRFSFSEIHEEYKIWLKLDRLKTKKENENGNHNDH